MPTLANCVITRIVGPGDRPHRAFHVFVRDRDGKIHDFAIYDSTYILEQMKLRNIVNEYIDTRYGEEKYNMLVRTAYENYRPFGPDHFIDVSYQGIVLADIHPVHRRHLAAFKIQQFWRRARLNPNYEACRKFQLQRIATILQQLT